MTSYLIEGFEFLPGAIVFEDEHRTKWRVCVPPQSGLDLGLGTDVISALGANKDRIVGRVICRFKDGTPASSALYLDAGGDLHWSDPLPVQDFTSLPPREVEM